MNEQAMEVPVKTNYINLSISIIGLVMIIIGALLSPTITQKTLFAGGCVFLFTASCIEKATFFAILQVIVLLGTAIAFFHISITAKLIVLGVVSIIALVYLYKRNFIQTFIDIVGSAGLLLLAFGYAVSNPFVYLFGGLFLAIYSYSAYKKGVKIGLIFAILNVIFTVMALISVLRIYG